MSIFDEHFAPSSRPQQRRNAQRPSLWVVLLAVFAALAIVILVLAMWPSSDEDELSAASSSTVTEGPSNDDVIDSSEFSDGTPAPEAPISGEVDLYAPPQDLGGLIATMHASTVTIYCGDIQGSGWALELGEFEGDQSEEDAALEREYPYEIVTNHHVIEPCIDGSALLEAQVQDEILDAYLYSWDEENDLALVAIKQNVPALKTSSTPQPGWWAMAVGTPYGLEGSIAIGNVMNTDATDVVSTAPLNGGMSGGPLVNSRGEVMGTNTWFYLDDEIQDWNVAVGLPALCDQIVACDGDDYWSQGDE